MPLFAFQGGEPQVSPGAWIAPTATLVGDARVEAEASVWYGAVLRADFGPIVVRHGANIQDGSVLHGGDDPVTEIGEGATVRHPCVVHGAAGSGRSRRHDRGRSPGPGRRRGHRPGEGVGRYEPGHLPRTGPTARGRRPARGGG